MNTATGSMTLGVVLVVLLLALVLPTLLLYATSGRTRCKDVRATTRKLVRYGLYVQLAALVPLVPTITMAIIVAGMLGYSGPADYSKTLLRLALFYIPLATLVLFVATPIVALQYLNAVEASDATDCTTVDVGRRRALVAMGAVLAVVCAAVGVLVFVRATRITGQNVRTPTRRIGRVGKHGWTS
jgi:hypothetical protein